MWRARALLMAVGRWVLAVGWLKLAVIVGDCWFCCGLQEDISGI